MMGKITEENCVKKEPGDGEEGLQDMVAEMKSGFSTALEALTQIQMGDQVLQEKVHNNKLQQDNQLADVLHMVLSLKTEFNTVTSQLHAATDNQNRLQRQIDILQCERDILLEELERQGAISEQLRQKYHSGRVRPNGLNRTSDQTSISAMLERAHTAFSTPHAHNISDHDSGVNTYRDHPDLSSLADVSPPRVNPMVHSYIAGLQDSFHQSLHDSLHQHSPPANIHSHSLHDSLHLPHSLHNSINHQSLHDGLHHLSHHEDLGPPIDHYDSDSSLTVAVNKSLDLSRSLGDVCAAEVAVVESSDDEGEEEKDKDQVEIVDMGDNLLNTSSHQSNELAEKIIAVDQPGVFAQPLTPKRVAPHERNTKQVQRMRIAREIMETERKYCSNLWTVLDIFLGPLQSTGILQPKEASVMFPPSLAAIYDYHCGFLQKLEERITNWKWHSVLGDILCRFIDSADCDLLSQYQNYVNDFPASLCQIRKSCKHTARFRKFLRMMLRHPTCDGLDLGCFMVTPIQRIPRYVLLLKQLLKFTDREHPDYYYIETALEHLGDFLNRLNDSIEYSMQIVSNRTAEETPKMRRKLRIGSFRSGSINSYDANSSKMNESSINGGDDHSILSQSTNTSTSRFFNFSFLRDSFKRKSNNTHTNNVNHSYVSTPAPAINTKLSARASMSRIERPAPPQDKTATISYSQSFAGTSTTRRDLNRSQTESSINQSIGRDQSFSADQSFTGSIVRGDKKRRPRRRHRSGTQHEVPPDRPVHHVPRIRSSGGEVPIERMDPLSKKSCNQRPRSMMDSVSETSLRSSTVTSQSAWPNTTSQESLSTLTGDTPAPPSANTSRGRQRGIGSADILQILPNMPKTMPYPAAVKTKSLPDVSNRIRPVPRQNSRKLPIPPTQPAKNDYGIYGDHDDLSDDGCFKPPLPVHHKNMGRKTEHLPVPRSASQGDIIDGSHSPSQDYINIALARSLTENHLDDSLQQPLPRTSTSLLETAPPHASTLQYPQNHDNPRPRSAKPRHVTLPRQGSHPQVLNITSQSVYSDNSSLKSPDVSTGGSLNNATIDESPNRKEMPFKRKKERTWKKLQMSIDGDGDKDKKKGSLKQSIKSLFFRKRSSRVVELIPYNEYPENGHQVYSTMASPTSSLSNLSLQATHREQAPPRENIVVLNPVEPQLETYADEHGEPCSAV